MLDNALGIWGLAVGLLGSARRISGSAGPHTGRRPADRPQAHPGQSTQARQHSGLRSRARTPPLPDSRGRWLAATLRGHLNCRNFWRAVASLGLGSWDEGRPHDRRASAVAGDGTTSRGYAGCCASSQPDEHLYLVTQALVLASRTALGIALPLLGGKGCQGRTA